MIVTGVVWLSMASGAGADPAPEYFNLPAGYSAGTGIAPAPDGTVWFPANPTTADPALGRLSTAQAAAGTANGMTTYPTPKLSSSCCANAVRSVAYDPANNRVWFVQNDGIVGFASPPSVAPGTSNGIQAILLGGASSPSLLDIAVAPSGLAWFTENSSSHVAPYPGGRIVSIDGALGVSESENIALQGGATTLNPLRYDSKPAARATGSRAPTAGATSSTRSCRAGGRRARGRTPARRRRLSARGGARHEGQRVVRARTISPPGRIGRLAGVDQICVGPPQDRCSLVYIISAHEYVTGSPGSHSRAAAVDKKKRGKPKAVVLGKKTVTLRGGQHKKVTIALNKTRRKLLKRKGRLQVYFTATQAQANGKAPKRVKKAKLTLKAKRR
jgi:hypothetical protein